MGKNYYMDYQKRINIPLTPEQKAFHMKSWAISEAWEKAKGGG